MSFFLAAIFGLAAWAHFELVGRVVAGPVTVWVAWFWSTVFVALVFILRDRRWSGDAADKAEREEADKPDEFMRKTP